MMQHKDIIMEIRKENEKMEIGKFYSFKSYNTETKWLFKVLSFDGMNYIVEHIEDLLYPPFRKYKGSNIIDKFTLENWISERELKEEILK